MTCNYSKGMGLEGMFYKVINTDDHIVDVLKLIRPYLCQTRRNDDSICLLLHHLANVSLEDISLKILPLFKKYRTTQKYGAQFWFHNASERVIAIDNVIRDLKVSNN